MARRTRRESACKVPGTNFDLGHGDVAIAAITSCTNTSNPYVMVAAGMLARNAVKRGLQVKPWVKTSLAPGSQVVTDYLEKAGLQHDLDTLGFNLVGYGCTTCIGNSGPLPEEISKTIQDHGLAVASVLSGNRNFEGRVNHDVQANYLASPPLVVAYALAGSVMVDLTTEPLGTDAEGVPVYLKDLWPSSKAVAKTVRKAVKKSMFRKRYGNVFEGDKEWQDIEVTGGLTYEWDVKSTYVQEPPYFVDLAHTPKPVTDIVDARILGLFLDSITTDHISPAGAIKRDSPAGRYLTEHGVAPHDFNSYGSRRGNHEVMMRGTFANTRIKNQMLKGIEGGVTLHYPSARGHEHLRRGDALWARGRADRDLCRQGIRHRLVARLGGEGAAAARRARGDCRELRAHPPLKSDRHGHPAARLRRRHELAIDRADRS